MVGVSFSLFELFCKPLLYYIHERIWYRHIKFGVTKVEDTIKPDLRIVESMSTGGDSTVTTTGPKRLVYTKKAG
jgi:(2Fe-2S) ferredoxin